MPVEFAGSTIVGPTVSTATWSPYPAAKSSGAMIFWLLVSQVEESSSATKPSLNPLLTNSGNSSEKNL